MKRIGFIGLGTMGLPMASNLIAAGFELTVYNRTLAKSEKLAAKGAEIASTPAEAARDADAVITMLTADTAVIDVSLGKGGIVETASAGGLILDCSTVSPAASQRLHRAWAKAGIDFLDAPVSGSEPQAIERGLTFMVGGSKSSFARAQPLFAAMGKGAYHMGDAGAGSYAKLANNTLVAINLLGLSESLTMAAKAGVDLDLFLKVVAAGGARSGMADMKGPKILERDFRPHFMVELMQKDLRLAQSLADELGIPLPGLAQAKELMKMAVARGYGREDIAAVVKCYEEWARIDVT